MSIVANAVFHNRTAVADVAFCERCRIALCVLEPCPDDPTLCLACAKLLEADGEPTAPCQRCGRTRRLQFDCGWCGKPICDGCCYAEHEQDDCRNPDDIEE